MGFWIREFGTINDRCPLSVVRRPQGFVEKVD